MQVCERRRYFFYSGKKKTFCPLDFLLVYKYNIAIKRGKEVKR